MQLVSGNGTSNGILEILYQREWYTMCSPYYYYYYSNTYYNHGDVVCKELGYDGGVVVSDSRRQQTSERMYRYQLWYYYYLDCEGTEDSIYDCDNRYGEFYYTYCSNIAEYSCQSKFTKSSQNTCLCNYVLCNKNRHVFVPRAVSHMLA